MKKSIVYLVLLLTACNLTRTNQSPDGNYVCQFQNEFSNIADTLLLQKVNDNYYKITRHSGVTNKINNKKQVINEQWKLEFEESKNVFTEVRTGKIILWDAAKHELLLGNRNYRRK